MKRAYERLLVKPSCSRRPQNIGDTSTMGVSTKNSSSSGVESTRSRSASKGRAGEVTPALWRSPEDLRRSDHVCIPDTGTTLQL
jgi:flagellar basal body L-ring protein FlgH